MRQQLRKLLTVPGVAFVGLATPFSGAAANAATVTPSIVINSAASTSGTCSPASGLAAQLAAGTEICPIAVTPIGWARSLALSGTNAGTSAISSGTSCQELVVGSPALDAGTSSATIAATP